MFRKRFMSFQYLLLVMCQELLAAGENIELWEVHESRKWTFPDMSSTTLMLGLGWGVEFRKIWGKLGIIIEWALQHGRWSCNKYIADGFGDKESERWPVCIAGVEVSLELVKHVYLNISMFVVMVFVEGPSNKILEVVDVQSLKILCVASKYCIVFPYFWVCCDSITNPTIHGLWLDVDDPIIIDVSAPCSPSL